MFFLTIALILCVISLVYLFLIWNYDYWKKRGVNGPKPKPLLGNYPNILSQKRAMAYDIDDIYRAYKGTDNFVGIYSIRIPQLLILNPEVARRIYVTDFKHFHDHDLSTMFDEESDFIFANNPFILTGEEWKERRAEITPGLTISRIKIVYPVTNKICNKMTDYIRKQLRSPSKDGINAKDLALRYTSDLVTDCVLGLNADSFAEKPTPIVGMIHKLFQQSSVIFFYFLLIGLLPSLKLFHKAKFIPMSVEKFFTDIMQTAINARRTQEQDSDAANSRADFLNYLLRLQDKKNLSTLQLTARTMTFLLDGYETTALVLSHTLLLIARHPAILQKLRSEIEEHLNAEGLVDFDKLVDLPYLDACIHEAIRIFPPALFSNRLCTESIEFTNKNGRTLRVEKGENVFLPAYSFMNDEEYYENPKQYQPERFLEENGGVKTYRDMGVYYGFGDGPRMCLGMRFALVQIKAAIVEILHNFNVSVNPKTRRDNLLDPQNFLASLNGGIWLDFEARN